MRRNNQNCYRIFTSQLFNPFVFFKIKIFFFCYVAFVVFLNALFQKNSVLIFSAVCYIIIYFIDWTFWMQLTLYRILESLVK